MADITIVHGVYKPTNITGGHHPVPTFYVSKFALATVSQGYRNSGESKPECFDPVPQCWMIRRRCFLKWLFNPWVFFKGRHFCQKMEEKKHRLIEFLLGIYLLVDPAQPQADRQAICGWITPIIPYLRGWAYTHLSYSGVFAEEYPGFGTYAMYHDFRSLEHAYHTTNCVSLYYPLINKHMENHHFW